MLPIRGEAPTTVDAWVASPTHPVLIVNPWSGSGRAAAIGLIPAAQAIGLEAVTMRPGEDLAELARGLVDKGYDHLMMAGGDGSLATVAAVAMERDVAFSCVPVGTRNHFAMDIGLDRSDPLRSLDAAFDGVETTIGVGLIAGKAFLNNVSFGVYARAIADPDYRSHRARSIAGAAVGTARSPETHLTFTLPDGRVVADVEVLLVSNGSYLFTGPPDFARRPALGAGNLGVILADRDSRLQRGPAAFTRWETNKLVVHSGQAEVQAGVDGELRTFRTPIEIEIAPSSLRVIVPRAARPKRAKESIGELSERAIARVSGLPTPPRRDEATARLPLVRKLHRVDEETFERIAQWKSPVMDRVMPALSEAASHSKLWIAAALVLAVTGGEKGRKTAVAGLVAVGITSLLANLVAKNLFRRRRPTDDVPEERRLPTPESSSMPSGHAASAAAFSRVVGAAYPALRIPLNVLAAAIGFSRVYTGVHYPTDVAAGWGLGKGVGAATSRTSSERSPNPTDPAPCRRSARSPS